MSDADAELLAAIGQLHDEAGALRDDVQRVTDQSRRLRVVTVLLCVALAAIVTVGGLAFVDDQRDDRDACRRGNEFRGQVTKLADAVEEIIDSAVAGSRSERAREFAADAHKLIAQARPTLRNCG